MSMNSLFEKLLTLREEDTDADKLDVKDEAERDGSTVEGEETKDDIGREMKIDQPGVPDGTDQEDEEAEEEAEAAEDEANDIAQGSDEG